MALRIAPINTGVATLDSPDGTPRLRSVNSCSSPRGVVPRVRCLHQKRPFRGRHDKPLARYKHSDLIRVHKSPTKEVRFNRDAREPTSSGFGVSHSTDLMFLYHTVELSRLDA